MLISHKGHTDTIQVYSVTVMTHVKALQAGHSSQGTSEPITPGPFLELRCFISFCKYVAGLIQAVLFYLRVGVLCHYSRGVYCSI